VKKEERLGEREWASCLRGRRQPGNLSERFTLVGSTPGRVIAAPAMHYCIDGYESMYVDVVLVELCAFIACYLNFQSSLFKDD
jgi:hypothetical protein